MTDPQTGQSPRPKKRVRTKAQLERKRARDRESQRASREKNRQRMAVIENELAALRARYDALKTMTENLVGRPIDESTQPLLHPLQLTPDSDSRAFPVVAESVASSGSSMGVEYEFSTAAASQSGTLEEEVQLPYYPDIADIPSPEAPEMTLQTIDFGEAKGSGSGGDDGDGLDNTMTYEETYIPGDFTSDVIPNDYIHHVLDASLMIHASYPLTPAYADALALDKLVADPPLFLSPTISSTTQFNCLCCFLNHVHTECFERDVSQLLLEAHISRLGQARNVPKYPRSPSLANLLLIDVDSNPIVRVLGRLMRRTSPISLPDSIAIYFILYRLLRVCEAHLISYLWPRPFSSAIGKFTG